MEKEEIVCVCFCERVRIEVTLLAFQTYDILSKLLCVHICTIERGEGDIKVCKLCDSYAVEIIGISVSTVCGKRERMINRSCRVERKETYALT